MGTYQNPIVQGLQAGIELKNKRQQNELEGKRIENEAKYHQSLIDDAQSRLKESHDEFQAQNELAKQAHAVQMLGAKQAIQNELLTTGASPGFSVKAQNPDGTVTYTGAHDHPLMPDTEVTLPSPEKYTRNQADLQRIKLAPQTEQKIAEETAKQQSELQKQLQVDAARETLKGNITAANQKAHDAVLLQIRKDTDEASLGRANIQAGATLGAASIHANATTQAARIRTGAEMFGQGGADPSPYIQGIQDGTLTQQQLNDTFKGQPLAGAYIKQAAFNGAKMVPITDKQQATVGNLQQLYSLIPKMEQLANTSTVMHPAQVYEMNREIQAEIAKVATTVAGDAGQRLQKALIDKAGGFTVGPFTSKEQAVNRIANFKRVVQDTFNDTLQSQSPTQRASIWGRVTGTLGAPGASAGQAAGQGQPAQAPPSLGGLPTQAPPTGSEQAPPTGSEQAPAGPQAPQKKLVTVRKPDGTYVKEYR